MLNAYAHAEDDRVYALFNAIQECYWSDQSVDATLRALAQAAVEVLEDLWTDPRLTESIPLTFELRIIPLLRGPRDLGLPISRLMSTGNLHRAVGCDLVENC